MNIFNLVVFVVCLKADGSSANTRREDNKLRDDIFINRVVNFLVFISYECYLRYFLGLDINENKIRNDVNFNDLFMQAFTHKDKHSLFMFKNISWALIVESLNKLNVQVTGGMSNRRHLTSPLSIRHHSYLLALFNYDSIALTKCVDFNNILKDWVLPRTDVTVKSKVQFYKDGSVVIHERDNINPEFNAEKCDKSVPPFTIIDESEEKQSKEETSNANLPNLSHHPTISNPVILEGEMGDNLGVAAAAEGNKPNSSNYSQLSLPSLNSTLPGTKRGFHSCCNQNCTRLFWSEKKIIWGDKYWS